MEMLGSCLFGAVIPFTRLFTYDVVIALTGKFCFTADVTLVITKSSDEEVLEDESI